MSKRKVADCRFPTELYVCGDAYVGEFFATTDKERAYQDAAGSPVAIYKLKQTGHLKIQIVPKG